MNEYKITLRVKRDSDGRIIDCAAEHPARMPQSERVAGLLELLAVLCRVGPAGYAGDEGDIAVTS